MELKEAIRARRSVRKYVPNVPIPEEDIKTILEAAMMAPSACNCRPWEFVVVRDPEIKEKLVSVHPFCGHAREASAVIVVCGMPDRQRRVAQGFWVQDCAAATENILLQALDLGYGTCWCGLWPREERAEAVRQLLDVNSTPFCIITLGVSAEEPVQRGFYEEEKVIFR